VERLLAESEAARAEAEEANHAKAQFLTHMSHELRTPLNAIGGYTELLQLEIPGPLEDQQQEYVGRIRQSQRHLLGLINEVLNFARLETGSVHYDIREVVVREVLASTEALVAPQAHARDLTLVVHPLDPAVVARADEEKLRQVLTNLLSNAVKFTPPGGRIEVHATCDGAGDGAEAVIRIHVRDTGIGIAADKLDAIFEPFVQVRSDLTRPYEGTGLGLAISRDLMKGVGGDLTVVSEPGRGSTFTVTVPRA
jgi:signal transduction histidine kinase